MLKVAILGEIGSGNLGDDYGYCLIRDILYSLFEKYDVVCNIQYFAPVQFSVLRAGHFDVVITSCGTLLDETKGNYVSELLDSYSKKRTISILGTGLSDSCHIIPTDEGADALSELRDVCKHSWIRGEDGPDVFWVFGKYCNTAPLYDGNVMGVNIGRAAFQYVDAEVTHSRIIDCFNHFKETHKMRTVSAWKEDTKLMPYDIPSTHQRMYVDGSRSSIESLKTTDSLISFRAHLGVIATCCGVLVFPVLFSSKVKKIYDLAIDDMKYLDVRDDTWIETIEGLLSDSETIRLDRESKVKLASEIVYNNLDRFVKGVI